METQKTTQVEQLTQPEVPVNEPMALTWIEQMKVVDGISSYISTMAKTKEIGLTSNIATSMFNNKTQITIVITFND